MDVVDAAPDLPGRLGMAVQMLAHARKTVGERGELTPTRLTTLAVMSSAGPMRMGALASRLGVQVSTMSRIVDVLVASGWAERRPDEADHRACVIANTPAGADLIDSVRRSNETRLADCISRLAPSDLAVLHAALPVLEELAHQVTSNAGEAATVLRGGSPYLSQTAPVMLGSPFSRCPVNRCDHVESPPMVIVTSYQPELLASGSSTIFSGTPGRTL
jgi:DNA-binding MarR family transcriptional regulator